jgi:hypothetical protein
MGKGSHWHRSGRFTVGAALAMLATGATLAATAGAASAAAPRLSTAHAAGVHGDAIWLTAPAGRAATPGAPNVQPTDPALAERVAAWVTGGGEAALNTLGHDFKALETAANAEDLGGMGTACGQLGVDVAAAQTYAPIPDAGAQGNWAAALSMYANGATDCVIGAVVPDYTELTNAAGEIMTGSNDLDKVTSRLNQIAGRTSAPVTGG